MKKVLITIGAIAAVAIIAGIGVILWQTRVPYVEKNVDEWTTTAQSAQAATTQTTNPSNDKTEIVSTQPTTPQPATDGTFQIQLHFVGDLLCATDARTHYDNCFEDVAARVKPSYFLKKVSKYFKNDDFTIGDAENVYSNKNLPISEKGQSANPNIEAYWFKTKKKNARILKAGGIDYVSIENNHIMDYGLEGKQDTKKATRKAGVIWGDEAHIRYFQKQGYKLAVIAISMYNDVGLPNFKKYIKKASKKSDYQIICFHGGTEAIHEPEAWKVNACHKLIDYGADLVIGDHPHVLQPMQNYKGHTIIYSMGNFVFGGNRHPENRTIIYRHTLTVSPDLKLKSEKGKVIPCYVYTGDTNNWQPAPIKDKAARKNVKRFMKGKRKTPF